MDGQRLYSVLTRGDVRDKMMKEIVQISEVFSLSQSDATVALIRLGWDSFRASDLLGDNKEKFLSELGLVQVPGSNHTDGDGDNLVSTPFCSHKFCSDCWRDHLSESVDKKEDKKMISCLNQDCVASVGPDTIEKLEEPVKEMYERYVLGSFMDSNKIKWCPASGCDYAIERHEDVSEDDESSDFGVVCLCGHTFCWKCKLESHRPVTCNNASLWLNKLLGEARTLVLNAKMTKPCPRCQSLVKRHITSDLRIVTCLCSYAFCWRCLRSVENHRGIYRCPDVKTRDEVALLSHLALWEASHKAMKASKHDLEAIERNSMPVLTERCGLGELDMKAVREACMLIVQCRLVLKWSSVFGYFLTDYHSGRKQYLDHLVEKATANLLKHKGTLDELVSGAIVGGDINGFRHKLETSTTATGNYFHVFVKTVEDGLCEVKAGVFENVATDYWFCDRCTFQNDSFEQKCRICVFPFEGPSPLVALGDNNNSTAVAHQQQVPNVSSNPFASPPLLAFGFNNSSASAHQQQAPNMSGNPFAGQGGTNVFESRPVVFGNNNIGANAQQQQVNNPFASPGGTFGFPMSPLPVAFSNISIGASDQQQQVPNANNPFAHQGGLIFSELPPPVAYGNYSFGASAHQQMVNNPFARPGGTSPLMQSPPFVGFGNNGTTASAHQQQAPDMMVNNPFARQGGTNPSESGPHVGLGYNNNSSASDHQQQAPNMPNHPPLARQGETKAWKLD